MTIKVESLSIPDVTVYVDQENGQVTLQHLVEGFSLHLRMSGQGAMKLAHILLDASEKASIKELP